MPLDFGKYQGASQITEKCTFCFMPEILKLRSINFSDCKGPPYEPPMKYRFSKKIQIFLKIIKCMHFGDLESTLIFPKV